MRTRSIPRLFRSHTTFALAAVGGFFVFSSASAWAADVNVLKPITLISVMRSESEPKDTIPGSLGASVSVATTLHSTRQSTATVHLEASCTGTHDSQIVRIDGSNNAFTLPMLPNAKPAYPLTLAWDGTLRSLSVPAQDYLCTVEAVVKRRSGGLLTTTRSPALDAARPWTVESYSDLAAVPVSQMSDGTFTVSSTVTLESDPDGSSLTHPVQLIVTQGAVLESPVSPSQTGMLTVGLDLLQAAEVPTGSQELMGLGQVVRLYPLDTQVTSGSVELVLPYDANHFDPGTLVPARFDVLEGEWLTCDIDPGCRGYTIDTEAQVLRVQADEFSEWTTVDGNGPVWRVSFTSSSGAAEVQVVADRNNTISAQLTVLEFESSYSEQGTPVTDTLEGPYVRWLTSPPTYPANSSSATGALGDNNTCAGYPANCPYLLNDVNLQPGTYDLQAVLDMGYSAYRLSDLDWSDWSVNTQCPGSQPSGEARLKFYHCLKVRSVVYYTWYQDSDGDKYGNPAVSIEQETAPVGYVSDNTDCDDTKSTVHPNASEIVGNEIDENCKDGEICYTDADGDGYRSNTNTIASIDDADCKDTGEAPSSKPGENCDDNKNSNPGKSEVCDANNVDEDCDGGSDDGDSSATGKTTWYEDMDNDTYGTSVSQTRCDANDPYRATRSGDCNDSTPDINPSQSEKCDGTNTDEDCDGVTDDNDPQGASGKTAWYYDSDNDGYGTSSSQSRCDANDNYRAKLSGDCEDNDSSRSPGKSEVCDSNNVDEDCDNRSDDDDPSATEKRKLYLDSDGDTYGNTEYSRNLCDPDGNYRATSTGDCNDGNSSIHPGAVDVCGNGVDEDCDNSVDDGCAYTFTFSGTMKGHDDDGWLGGDETATWGVNFSKEMKNGDDVSFAPTPWTVSELQCDMDMIVEMQGSRAVATIILSMQDVGKKSGWISIGILTYVQYNTSTSVPWMAPVEYDGSYCQLSGTFELK